MPQYIKKPVTIEAYQFSGNQANPGWPIGWLTAKHHFITKKNNNFKYPPDVNIIIETLEGEMTGIAGDYIVKGIAQEFYPVKEDIFKKTYEEIS